MRTITIAMILLGLSHVTKAETKEFGLKDISKIEINNGAGNVNITAIESGKATVTAIKKEFGEHCKLIMDKKGTNLLIEVKKSGFFKAGCNVDFNIAVLKTTAFVVDTGSGDLNVKGTSGDLIFNIGSGSVNVDAEVKKLIGKSGSGDISIQGLTSGGKLSTGSGTLNLVYKVAPTTGELDLSTGSGDAKIILPKAAKIRTSFFAGSGELINELGDTPQSLFKISMDAGSGNLHIKKQ